MYLSISLELVKIGLVRRYGHVDDLLLLLLLRVGTSLHDRRRHALLHHCLRPGHDVGVAVVVFDFVLKVSRASLEDRRLGPRLELPVGASALVGLSWHFVETLVQGQVVSDRVLPVARVHSVVRVFGTDGLVDLGEGQHAVAGVNERFGYLKVELIVQCLLLYNNLSNETV